MDLNGQRKDRAPMAKVGDTGEAAITFEDNKRASLVFGQYDQNIAHLERKLGLLIHNQRQPCRAQGAPRHRRAREARDEAAV